MKNQHVYSYVLCSILSYIPVLLKLALAFSLQLRSSAPGECHQVMKNLQTHYEDFLQESRDSALFSVADRLRLEEEVEACKTHFQQLMKSMENGVCLGRREEGWIESSEGVLLDPSYKLGSAIITFLPFELLKDLR